VDEGASRGILFSSFQSGARRKQATANHTYDEPGKRASHDTFQLRKSRPELGEAVVRTSWNLSPQFFTIRMPDAVSHR
jgi:hypothetical protein